MSKSWLTYRIFLPLLATMSLVGFWRINKVSFFHHFIRVISEVEVRNSQSLSEASLPVLALASEAQDQQAASAVLFAGLYLAVPVPAAQEAGRAPAVRLSGSTSSPILIRGP